MAMDGYRGFLGLLVSALLVGFLSVIFTLIWVLHYRGGLGWDGSSLEFNWHPVLVVTGFVFIQGIGTGHLLGGGGEQGAGLGVLDRVSTEGDRRGRAEGVRAGPAGAGEQGAELAPGPRRQEGGACALARPGTRRAGPWLMRASAGGRGLAASRVAQGGCAPRRQDERAGAGRPHLVNALQRVAGTHLRHCSDIRNESPREMPWGPARGSSHAGARSLPEDGACAVRGAQTLFRRGLSAYLLLDCFLGEQGTGEMEGRDFASGNSLSLE